MDIVRAYYKADPVKYAKDIEEYLKKAYKTSKNNEPAIYISKETALQQPKIGTRLPPCTSRPYTSMRTIPKAT